MLNQKKKIFVQPENIVCNVELGWKQAIPFFDGINTMNRLAEAGHEIFYWTSCTDDDIIQTIKKKFEVWHVAYTDIGIGKPEYDLWIDPNSRILSERLVYLVNNGLEF